MINKIPSEFRLGLNTGFAVNRYSEPEEWVRILGDELGVQIAQFTADLLNVDLSKKIIHKQVDRIQRACEMYKVSIPSTFTGGFTRVNHLAHPDPDIRKHWLEWFKRFVDLSVDLGSSSMGSHFGIFTHLDNNNLVLRNTRRQQNIDGWHEVANYAKDKGLEYISWEPMSINREQGETISEARKLQNEVNLNSPLPFKICLDVDHGDLSSSNPCDTDPYEWLKEFALESPIIHLKQTNLNKSGHWPFVEEYNKVGRIQPDEFVQALIRKKVNKVDLYLEPSFKEREPYDSTVIEVLKESVDFWRQLVKN